MKNMSLTFSIFGICLLVPLALKAQPPTYPPSVEKAEKALVYRMNIYSKPPSFGEGVRLAIFQNRDHVGSKEAMAYNFSQLERAVESAKRFDAQIISFPELYLTGYALNPKMARDLSQFSDGPYIKKAQAVAKKNRMAIVLPYAEKAKGKDDALNYYDAIALINSKGELLESYRKTHLFALAERINWSAGDGPYNVYKINGYPIGLLNCYEAEFPELQRILALKGAKLIVIPTAADYYYTMPDGNRTKVPYPDVSKLLIPAAAYANNIFVAYSNHVGYEQIGKDKWLYQGNSVIADPYGKLLLAADRRQTTLLIADILPKAYGPTHPSKANYLRDRRPRLYHDLHKTTVPFGGGHQYPAYPAGKKDYPGYPTEKKESP